MAKRKYVKKSDYWKNKSAGAISNGAKEEISFEPALVGESFYNHDQFSQKSKASRINSSSQVASRRGAAKSNGLGEDRYSLIRSGALPYEYSTDGVSVKDAIQLCQRAYANVAIFRNAIDIMSEFANSEVYLEEGSKKSNAFFEKWFERINLKSIKDQFFREYYRSGNIPLYRIEGKFDAKDYEEVTKKVGSVNPSQNKIPLKYVLLNPYDITANVSTDFSNGTYEKLLSKYELIALKNPQTDQDQEVFDALPADVKDKIEKGSFQKDGVSIQLDPLKLLFCFYKKQDYEPFAVPFGFPVLDDINAKMELKKVDQAITRTVENVLLLITMGAEPEKGGINPENITAMQNLFANESSGRVLVSDWTTEAQFVIPDLKKVLGKEKYEILNEDIKQGLQNIVVGEEKYSSTQVKAQIFIDRLKDARDTFLVDFLQPEIKRVAKQLGLKSYPTAKMKDIDMKDESQLMKVATRMMELGVLTPEQGMDMFHTGKFPKAKDLKAAQEEFKKDRESGKYNPIVGGVPMFAGVETQNKMGKSNKPAGRPEGTTGIPIQASVNDVKNTIYAIEDFNNFAQNCLKDHHKTSELNEHQKSIAQRLCQSVICSEDKEYWEDTLTACVSNNDNINELNSKIEIISLAAEHEISEYEAAIMYHSNEKL